MIQPVLGTFSYADGTSFTQEPIHQSNNGWTYKPDSIRTDKEIKSGKNKVWPRDTGPSDGRDYMRLELIEHLESRNWETPIFNSENRNTPAYQNGDSLSVAWFHRVWGWLTLSIRIRQRDGSIEHEFGIPVLAKTLLDKELPKHIYGSGHSVKKDKQVKDIQRHVNAFIANPWSSFTEELIYSESDWARVFGEIPNLAGLEYVKDDKDFGTYRRDVEVGLHGDVLSSSSDNGLFYKRGVIEAVYSSQHNWEALKELFTALEFTGFTIKPMWHWGGADTELGRALSGISITIPKQDGMAAHTIDIQADNPHVTITCGYQDDEDRWVDRKQREAVEQMEAMQQDLESIEYEIEL